MSRNRRGALEEGHAHTKRQQVLPTPSLIEGRSRRGRAPAWGGRQRPASLCGRRNTRTLDRDRACERERGIERACAHMSERDSLCVRNESGFASNYETPTPTPCALHLTPYILHMTLSKRAVLRGTTPTEPSTATAAGLMASSRRLQNGIPIKIIISTRKRKHSNAPYLSNRKRNGKHTREARHRNCVAV